MNDMFVRVLFGHFFGDYMLQGKKMAIAKSERGLRSLAWCALHSVIYTACVSTFVWRFEWWFVALVLLSHYPIDRFSLGGKWLKLIRGRDFMAAYESKDAYREIDIAFSCLVYAVVDNTMHLTLLWLVTMI